MNTPNCTEASQCKQALRSLTARDTWFCKNGDHSAGRTLVLQPTGHKYLSYMPCHIAEGDAGTCLRCVKGFQILTLDDRQHGASHGQYEAQGAAKQEAVRHLEVEAAGVYDQAGAAASPHLGRVLG